MIRPGHEGREGGRQTGREMEVWALLYTPFGRDGCPFVASAGAAFTQPLGPTEFCFAGKERGEREGKGRGGFRKGKFPQTRSKKVTGWRTRRTNEIRISHRTFRGRPPLAKVLSGR